MSEYPRKNYEDGRAFFAGIEAGDFNGKIPWPKLEDPDRQAKVEEYNRPQENFRPACEQVFLHGEVSQKKKNLLWTLAWDEGHSSGLYEVALYYREFAVLVDPD